MPLRSISESLAYGHPHLYSKSNPGAILQDVSMARMTGTLAQVGLVAHYAREMFEELFALAQDTHGRVRVVGERAAGVQALLREVDEKVRMLKDEDVSRTEAAVPRPEAVEFSIETAPKALKERYAVLEPVPDFSGVDSLFEEDGKCVVKYSNPRYFLDQWAAAEMEKIKTVHKEKTDKKRRKLKKNESSANNTVKRPSGLNWRQRFANDDDLHPMHRAQSASRIKEPDAPLILAPKSSPSSPPSPPKPPPPMPFISPKVGETARKTVPPPMMPFIEQPRAEEAAVEEEAETPPEGREEEEEEEEEAAAVEEPEYNEYAKYFKMLNMGLPLAAVQQKMRAEGMDPSVLDDSDDDDESVASLPPALPPATSGGPKLGGGLLAEIAAAPNKELRKVEKPSVDRPAPKGNDLLSAIKGGAQLKKVEPRTSNPAGTATTKSMGGLLGNEVDKILTLREKIAVASDDDDDDDDEWDDDDDF
ncbi:hypothetical protein CTAYLR_001707 [Chrysophaeum taylorii]|uniref:WH2 domain-containing protein n=1 Tax=Chrysophaeum taylorii TaxID=2483200 RepID=A0AAD7U7D8_9STRA|nr:hypothetical protein CTAYLR_001707 [Chrysophaeum taylorii]